MRKRSGAATARPSAEEREQALRFFVEDVGVQFEYGGMPRMAGRILAHLLVCEPPAQTAEELAQSIQASRASVSTMTRLLIHTGLVERQVRPGARRDLFRVRPGAFSTLMRERMRLVTTFRQALERGLEALAGTPAKRSERLREMYELYAWMERELPRLFEKFDAEQRRQRR